MKISNLVDRFSSRPDYHQLTSYSRVMEEIGWKVVDLIGNKLFVKQIGPIAFAKLQRPGKLDVQELVRIQKQKRILSLIVEPGLETNIDELSSFGFRQSKTHYAYTKTLICDLSGSESQILNSFSKTTSYQMRRSLKMGVEYRCVPYQKLQKQDRRQILALHKQWSTEKKVSGYEDKFLMAMWKHMSEGAMILAYKNGMLHGALFLLIHDKLGMYFYQFSSSEAREKLYIPSGLAYQAIKLCKDKGCDLFDLCSAYDERYPKENLKWKGFSTHKERFHPTPVLYPISFVRHSLFWF